MWARGILAALALVACASAAEVQVLDASELGVSPAMEAAQLEVANQDAAAAAAHKAQVVAKQQAARSAKAVSTPENNRLGEAAPKEMPPIPATPPTKLSGVVADRKAKRLQDASDKLKFRYNEAKQDHRVADGVATKDAGRLAKLETDIEEARSAKRAAKTEQFNLHQKLEQSATNWHNAADELHAVKQQVERAAAFLDEAKVQVQMASAEAQTSGADEEDLAVSETKRDEVDESYKEAQAELVSRKLALSKLDDVEASAKLAVGQKHMLMEEAMENLNGADRNYAEALWKEKNAIKERDELEPEVAASKGEAELTEKEQSIAHGLATAAAKISQKDSSGEEAQMEALVQSAEEHSEDSESDLGILHDVRQNEILGAVKDQDGFSESGKALVSPDGAIAAAYKKQFAALPLPNEGANPILDAEAKAATSKDNEAEADQFLADARASIGNEQVDVEARGVVR
jgi:hypothetical protein